jgi:membrane fusion protein (multidrug efflux system)
MNWRGVLLPLAVVVMGASCKKAVPKTAAATGAAPAAAPGIAVEVAVAKRDTVIDAIAATGQIEAVQAIELRPDVEGRIVEILVREGSEVAKGTPLFRIDDAELQAQVASAAADRDLAAQSLARTRDLVQQRASSQADLERAEAMSRSADASLALLQVRLDRTVVRAPFSGVVGQRFVSLGDYVTSSTRLASLQTVNPERVSFQVPERYAAQLRRNQTIAFQVAAMRNKTFTGTVDFVDPVVQLPGRTITVKALVPNPKRELQAGMFVDVRLATAQRPNAVVVPEDAVLALQGVTVVWVIKDGKATRRPVTLGVRSPGFVEITDGVEAGEQVVVGGIEKMTEGAAVTPQVVERTKPTVTEGR